MFQLIKTKILNLPIKIQGKLKLNLKIYYLISHFLSSDNKLDL